MSENQEHNLSVMDDEILPFLRTKNVSLHGMRATGKAGVIEVQYKKQFGRLEWYVVDPMIAAALYDLTRKKTLHLAHINALKVLGFRLVHVKDPQEEYQAP